MALLGLTLVSTGLQEQPFPENPSAAHIRASYDSLSIGYVLIADAYVEDVFLGSRVISRASQDSLLAGLQDAALNGSSVGSRIAIGRLVALASTNPPLVDTAMIANLYAVLSEGARAFVIRGVSANITWGIDILTAAVGSTDARNGMVAAAKLAENGQTTLLQSLYDQDMIPDAEVRAYVAIILG